MEGAEAHSLTEVETPIAANGEGSSGMDLDGGGDSLTLWPEDLAEALVDELLEETRHLPVGQVAGLSELYAKVPGLQAAVAELREATPAAAVLELPRGLPGLFTSSSFTAPLWIVQVPGADATELRLLSTKGAKDSPMLCPWPNLWHKDLRIPIGTAARPICVMLSQFSDALDLLRCDSAILLAYVSEESIAFGVRRSPVDEVSSHYLANYKPLRDYPLRVLQASVRATAKLQDKPHRVDVYQLGPSPLPTPGVRSRPAPLRNHVTLLEAETGYLSDMATCALDFPHELAEECLLIYASNEAYDYLLSSVIPEVSATLFIRAGTVERFRIRIDGPTDVLEIEGKMECGCGAARMRLLELPLFAQRHYDGALCAVPRLTLAAISTQQLGGPAQLGPKDDVASLLSVDKHRFQACLVEPE